MIIEEMVIFLILINTNKKSIFKTNEIIEQIVNQ